jgi:hypothetical protein
MSRLQIAVIAMCMFVLATVAQAASPEQVGTYAGKLKTKVSYTTGLVTLKSTMQVAIDADNFTTVTIDGIEQPSFNPGSPNSFYSPTDGYALWRDAAFSAESTIGSAVFHFKKTAITGTWNGLNAITGSPSVLISTSQGKFKLKKTP